MAWAEVEVIGVAENDFCAEGFQHVLRNGLHASGSSDRHEDWSFDRLVRKDELRAPSACIGLVE